MMLDLCMKSYQVCFLISKLAAGSDQVGTLVARSHGYPKLGAA